MRLAKPFIRTPLQYILFMTALMPLTAWLTAWVFGFGYWHALMTQLLFPALLVFGWWRRGFPSTFSNDRFASNDSAPQVRPVDQKHRP